MPASCYSRLALPFKLLLLLATGTLLTACQGMQELADMSFPNKATPVVEAHEKSPTQLCKRAKPVVKTRVVTRTEVIYQPVEVDHKLVVGAVEKVHFPNMGDLKLDARIDTGAATNSLHVTSDREFERDGERWVSFVVPVPGEDKPLTVERPLVRRVMVKRKGKESQLRLVVMLTVRVGKLEHSSEFTLTDRDNFEFPALIGRNFLTDMAIVDVSHQYLATEK